MNAIANKKRGMPAAITSAARITCKMLQLVCRPARHRACLGPSHDRSARLARAALIRQLSVSIGTPPAHAYTPCKARAAPNVHASNASLQDARAAQFTDANPCMGICLGLSPCVPPQHTHTYVCTKNTQKTKFSMPVAVSHTRLLLLVAAHKQASDKHAVHGGNSGLHMHHGPLQ